jgi:hypothetical protein
VCQRLGELREAVERFSAGFDAQLISPEDAGVVVGHAAAMEKMAATLKALAAARVAETKLSKNHGDRSAAHALARTTGSTVVEAARVLETGRRLEALSETAAAARRGELSTQQAAAIAEAAGADLESEARLLDQARRSSLQELKDECARIRATSASDLEASRMRIHASRYLRTYTDAEGAFNLRFRHNPEVGAEVMAALEPIKDACSKRPG